MDKLDESMRDKVQQVSVEHTTRILGGYIGLVLAVEVIRQYHGLWVVERAFRISKGTLEAHPIFHFTEVSYRGSHLHMLHDLQSLQGVGAHTRHIDYGCFQAITCRCNT